ncbi:uncharacterized protein LOC114362998 [Ostrinia furnacalis]|uniref:uncharacterized protein LOC114362998 n=1 Tax=Ostrinia furnacalis TaxID=93504 RepID=UPI00104006DD|nr:uncharacterized protein LOC114362998 [Ostrinia furnacalis]
MNRYTKMTAYTMLMMLCFQILPISSAPLQLQYQSQLSLQPTPEELLQHQLFALQQLQQLQNLQNLQMVNELNNYYPQAIQRQDAPLMILLPEGQLNNFNQNNDLTKQANVKTKTNEQDETNDSVVIDAEPNMEPNPETEPKKAILLISNRGRLSIGGLISAIPFLPIEINVPDSISWIYNGIAGIISGIGQRLPFKKPMPTPTPESDPSLRLLINRLQNRNQNVQVPILMLPDVAQVYPMQV